MKTIVAQVYVKKDDKILMVQENKIEKKGKWNMPAGKLEENESIIDAAIRETKEETNINVKITGLIAIHETITTIGNLIILYFYGEYLDGKIKFDTNEIADAKWMTVEEIKSLDKKEIRGGNTIDEILEQAEHDIIPLNRIVINNEL